QPTPTLTPSQLSSRQHSDDDDRWPRSTSSSKPRRETRASTSGYRRGPSLPTDSRRRSGGPRLRWPGSTADRWAPSQLLVAAAAEELEQAAVAETARDRKSTRLNSSH